MPSKGTALSRPSNIVHCVGPRDPHALDDISVRHRSCDLDIHFPVCAGHGQWNSQIELVSHRSIRVPSHDIAPSDEGHLMLTVRLDPSEDVE